MYQADRDVLGQHRQQRPPLVDAELALLAVADVAADADHLRTAGGFVEDHLRVDFQPVGIAGQHVVAAAPGHELAHEVVPAQQAIAQQQRQPRIVGITEQHMPERAAADLAGRVTGRLHEGRMRPLDDPLRVRDHRAAPDPRRQQGHPRQPLRREFRLAHLVVPGGQMAEVQADQFEQLPQRRGRLGGVVELDGGHGAVPVHHRQRQHLADPVRAPGQRRLCRRQHGQHRPQQRQRRAQRGLAGMGGGHLAEIDQLFGGAVAQHPGLHQCALLAPVAHAQQAGSARPQPQAQHGRHEAQALLQGRSQVQAARQQEGLGLGLFVRDARTCVVTAGLRDQTVRRLQRAGARAHADVERPRMVGRAGIVGRRQHRRRVVRGRRRHVGGGHGRFRQG
jgi:hypothetical protein